MIRPANAVLALLLAVAGVGSALAQSADDPAVKGRELMATGAYDAAIPFLQRDLAAVESADGEGSPALAAPLNDLAEANRLAGRLDQAEKLYRRALALDERAKRKDPVGTATTMNNLALVYRQEGRLQEAEKTQSRSLRMLEDSLGPNDGRVAMGLHNLAAIYRAQGRIGDARPLQERAVAVAEQALGPDNPDTRQFKTALAALGTAPQPSSSLERSPVPRAPGKGNLPPPPPDDDPPPIQTAAGGVVVILAAVRGADEVAGEWQRLVRRYPDLKGLDLLPTQAVEVKGKGTFYRVIGGPLGSKAEADSLCARLKKAGASCRSAMR